MIPMEHFTPQISIDLPRHSGQTVSVTDFGAGTAPDFCNTQPFRRALAYCKAHPTSIKPPTACICPCTAWRISPFWAIRAN